MNLIVLALQRDMASNHNTAPHPWSLTSHLHLIMQNTFSPSVKVLIVFNSPTLLKWAKNSKFHCYDKTREETFIWLTVSGGFQFFRVEKTWQSVTEPLGGERMWWRLVHMTWLEKSESMLKRRVHRSLAFLITWTKHLIRSKVCLGSQFKKRPSASWQGRHAGRSVGETHYIHSRGTESNECWRPAHSLLFS